MITTVTETLPTAVYNQFDIYKTFETLKPRLDGTIGYNASTNLNYMFDLAFVNNDLSVLSKTQRKDMEKYIAQADSILSNDMVQLDTYLGGL